MVTKKESEYYLAYNRLNDMQNILQEASVLKKDSIGASATKLFLNHIIDLIDATAILFYQKKIAAGMIVIRSVYEISLQLMYLLLDRECVETKAAYVWLINMAKSEDANNFLQKQKKHIGEKDTVENNINKQLLDCITKAKPKYQIVFKKVFDEIDFQQERKWIQTLWYKEYSEKNDDKYKGEYICNNNQLCLKVKAYDERDGRKISLNNIVYNLLSKQAHGANIINTKVENNTKWLLNLVLQLVEMLVERINSVYPILKIEEFREKTKEIENQIDVDFE